MDKSQGRTTRPQTDSASAVPETQTGNRGLLLEEKLIFEQGVEGRTGVDLPPVPKINARLGKLRRKGAIGLPGLSEPQAIRKRKKTKGD